MSEILKQPLAVENRGGAGGTIAAEAVAKGYRDLAMEPWYGLVAPGGTPVDIITKLSEALTEAVRTPEVRQRFERLGFVPLESTSEQLGMVIRTEMKTFEDLIERTRINPQQ